MAILMDHMCDEEGGHAMERCRSACLEGGRHVIRVRLGLGAVAPNAPWSTG